MTADEPHRWAEELTAAGVPTRLWPLFEDHGVGALIPRLGVVFDELTAQRTVAHMPVSPNTQPAGLLHGGATAALIETVASFAANVGAPQGHRAVGTELNVSHVRPGIHSPVRAVATEVRAGRTQAVHQVEVMDARGKLISIGRVTNAYVPV